MIKKDHHMQKNKNDSLISSFSYRSGFSKIFYLINQPEEGN